ncbi:MAG: 50S ribosomal protein L29 [Candidatus Geothermarchaeales archaeon]
MGQRKLERWRESDLKDLYRRLNEINVEYMKLTSLIKAGGAVEKPGRVKHLRRQRAKLLTIIAEKERGLSE